MFRHVEFDFNVWFPVKSLEKDGIVPKSLIAARVLYQLTKLRAREDFGYFISVTRLGSIGRGSPDSSSQCIIFPVNLCCRTVIPRNGEVMIGTVYKVREQGVFLKCGPMSHIYLSRRLMPNYSFVNGENPLFLSNDLSRIEKDCVIRFSVFAVRWGNEDRSRQFKILASIEDASLGPIQYAGSDGMDLENPYCK